MAKAKKKAVPPPATTAPPPPATDPPPPATIVEDEDGDPVEAPEVAAEVPVESKVIERTVVTTTERIYEAPIAPVVPVASIKAPAPSTRAPSVVQTVAAAPSLVSVVEPIPRPPSIKAISPVLAPAQSHHHPEVVVNVNLPAVPAPAPALPPIAAEPPPSIEPALIPLPASKAGSLLVSPTPTDMRLPQIPQILRRTPKEEPLERQSGNFPEYASLMGVPKALKASRDRYVVPVPLLEEDELDEQNIDEITFEEQGPGEQVVTQVVTTTTTRRIPSPAAAPTPPAEAEPQVHFSSYVENDPTYRLSRASAAPKVPKVPTATTIPAVPEYDPELELGSSDVPSPSRLPQASDQRVVKTVTVETTTFPAGGDIDSAASTMGGATTMGVGGAKSAMLGEVGVKKTGTKAGIKPIPYVDYETVAYPPKVSPPRIKPVVHGPKTTATLTGDLARDLMGNEHLHMRVRDHTAVRRVPGVKHVPVDQRNGLGKDIGQDIVLDKRGMWRDKERRKREPLYRRLGDSALAPPKSERYAYPPEETEIEHNHRKRLLERWHGVKKEETAAPVAMGGTGLGMGYYNMGMNPAMGMGMTPGMGMAPGMGMGMGGPPYPPPGPAMFPRPPPMMASRPAMYGPPMMNPMTMGSGMGSMGMLGMPMGQTGMPFAHGMGGGMNPGMGYSYGMGGGRGC